ncbi:M14 family zinc carboxypeptidase [Mangrovimonas cancribranchiae]|uniref:M14 family zinc carboxypeptidase n=1 Tax=Mangrovimonas cancribranchiae TaxID=3080055 RepID=A0AAU6P0X6_9FLAO
MKKSTLLLVVFTLVISQLINGQTGKRIKIQSPSQPTIDLLANEGIDLRCGAIIENNFIQVEVSEPDLEKIDQLGISYTVLINDLTPFYRNRAVNDLPKAIQELELEKSRGANQNQALQRASTTNIVLDNYLQYQGCTEVDWAVPANFNLGSMGGCLTVDEVMDELDDMHTLYPNLVSERLDASPSGQTTWGNTTGGASDQWAGQTIYYVRITGDQGSAEGTKPQVLHTSMIHSREVGALMGNIFFMWYILENYDSDPAIKNLVDNNELYFIPVVNPDGLRWNEVIAPSGGGLQRKNLRPNTNDSGSTSSSNNNRGVDLNRNFNYFWGSAGTGSSGSPSSSGYRGPSAASEPETQIIEDFVLSRNFKTAVWQHTYANAIPHPYGGNNTYVSGREDEMHEWHADMTRYNRYVSGALVLPPANGIADDWMLGGSPDSNGSSGSGQNILATTPENGHGSEASGSGFWPTPSNIFEIAKRMVRINLMNIYYGGKYAKLHDLTQSDITSLTSDLTFGIERIGQTSSNFTLTVTPISTNITNIISPSTLSGMSVLDQNNVTAQITLDSGIQPNEKVEYNVTLEDDSGNIFYDVDYKKYYQPNVLFSDNPDNDGTSNWDATGQWSTTSNSSWSGSQSIRNTSSSSYSNNSNSTLTTINSYDFSGSDEVLVQFYAKWDLERNYDFVELLATTNGSTWFPVCGKYTKPNSTYETNDAHAYKSSSYYGFQENNSSGQVYDGDQMDNWVMEEIVIDENTNSSLHNASNVQFRFRFRSDGSNETENYSANLDGFYVDDFKVIGLQVPCETTTPSGLTVLNITQLTAEVSWNDIPSATYDLRYREIGAPSWTEITDISENTYNLNGLEPSTNYEVQVATRCIAATSSYSTSENFTTEDTAPCLGTPIVSYPYTETWDTNIGDWSQGTGDDGEWSHNSGSTISSQTGPDDDFTEGGSYFYTEASNGDLGSGATVYLVSPCFDLNGYENANFTFYYHMHGADMGDLSLEVTLDNGNNWTNLTTLSGPQQSSNGAAWEMEDVDLSLYDGQIIKLRFVGLTGNGYRSDMAIDQINLTADVAGSEPPTAVCQNITVQLDETGSATIVAADIDNGSSDDVAITDYSIDIDTFDCNNVGTPVDVTLTVTDGDSQTDICTATVTVTQQDEPTAVNCWDNFVYNDTTCTWENLGTQPTEPTATNCWDDYQFNTTSCEWENLGSQPTEPTATNCWDDYQFNTTSCEWENLGSQPTEPTATNCWDDYQFNTSSCEWENLGTQPTEPTATNCWDNYQFNTSSCEWENLGSQPTEPTATNCWDDYQFNTTSCEWENLGSQPTEPTATNCWDDYLFNTTSCEWENLGTQPTEPTATNCWDDYQFNTSSCEWENLGTQPTEPTATNCWDDYQFNTSSCEWENLGTQPTEPTATNCWDDYQFNTTSCEWENLGSQPTEPTATNCWDDYLFNTTSCEWENLGTQPTEPTATNCWDDYQFNTSSCEWENLGTQPTEPTATNCWDDYQFNTSSCEWENLGTQPTEPTATNCWDDYQFNTSSCEWENLGSQPTEPTATNCWDDYQFNTSSCEWENLGTQPTEPSVECWETTTFNTTTCTWDINNDGDTVDPICMTQDITVTLSGGTVTITAGDIDNGSSDDCGIASLSVSPAMFDSNDIGDNNVVLTVTDHSGNSSNCNATVTVEEETLDIKGSTIKNLGIYPNPFNDIVYVTLPNGLNNDSFNVDIYDINGRLVFNKSLKSNNNKLEIYGLDNLEQALYLIKITNTSTKEYVFRKLIKFE